MTEPQTDAGKAMLNDPMYRFAIGHVLAIEAESRVGYVPASLSPEWRAELNFVAAESRNATLDEVLRVVEELRALRLTGAQLDGLTFDDWDEYELFVTVPAVLDAVKALQSPERT